MHKLILIAAVALSLGACSVSGAVNSPSGKAAIGAGIAIAASTTPALCSSITHTAADNALCVTVGGDLIRVGAAVAAEHTTP